MGGDMRHTILGWVLRMFYKDALVMWNVSIVKREEGSDYAIDLSGRHNFLAQCHFGDADYTVKNARIVVT